ncbi:hypothetical protein ROT00_00585 [Agromyces mediolanus]|uniref:hypothetical protein n=1 Tax=Agromyces mediolanus TaxID=41986 RepID=UPI0038344E35
MSTETPSAATNAAQPDANTAQPDATTAQPHATTGRPDAEPAAAQPSAPPSIHLRAIITWLAIFPLVAIGMLALAPVWADWHPVLRALLLTVIVVPLAVYLVVPRLLAGYGRLRRRAAATRR